MKLRYLAVVAGAICSLTFPLFVFGATSGTIKVASSTPIKLLKQAPSISASEFEDIRKTRIAGFVNKKLDEYVKLSDRQGALILKIEARLKRYADDNVETSTEQGLLDDTKVSYETAKAYILLVSERMDDALGVSGIKTSLEVARESLSEARDALLETHVHIGELIDALSNLPHKPPTSPTPPSPAQIVAPLLPQTTTGTASSSSETAATSSEPQSGNAAKGQAE